MQGNIFAALVTCVFGLILILTGRKLFPRALYVHGHGNHEIIPEMAVFTSRKVIKK